MASTASWTRAATGLVAALLTCVPAAAFVAGPAGAAPATADHVDPLTASAAEVVDDLQRLDTAVDEARTAAADADAALITAEDDLDAANARADRTRRGAEALERARAREVAPPTTDVFEMLGHPSAGVLDDARSTQAAERADASADAAAEARAAVDRAEADSTQAQRDREAAAGELDAFVTAVWDRSVARLAEADQLALTDPASADVMRADEAAVAAPLATVASHQDARAAEDAVAGSGAAGAAAPGAPAPAPTPAPAPAPPAPPPLPDPTGSASGALEGAWCADGRRIVVDASLGLSVQYLVNDAAAAGIGLCASSAFRTYDEQVQLRRQHCGTSDDAVFNAPPSTCSPPTARPGTSNHEDGLAIDFSCDDGQPMTHASPCYQWLAANAINYGLRNLPSEPWHWSVSGT